MPVRPRLKVLIAERNLERIRAGEDPITIRALSAATGLATSTIAALTSGRAKGVEFETLDKLCSFFGIEPGELFTRDEKQPS